MPKTWHVTFDLTVADAWIEDGFELEPRFVEEIVQEGILQYAYDYEKAVTNIKVIERTRKAPRRDES
jgi:hypothetical protein